MKDQIRLFVLECFDGMNLTAFLSDYVFYCIIKRYNLIPCSQFKLLE